MSKHVTFLRAAAAWFRSEAADAKEDKAHWANVYNAENCDKAADEIERLCGALQRIADAHPHDTTGNCARQALDPS